MFDILKKLMDSAGGNSSGAEPPSAQDMVNHKPGGGQSNALDSMQVAGDAAGVVDQTGVVDLSNAAISLLRGFTSKDPDERAGHFRDAGIRALSAIPIVGDFAKLGRAGKYASEGKSAFKMFGLGGKEAKAAGAAGDAIPSAADMVSGPAAAVPAASDMASGSSRLEKPKRSWMEWAGGLTRDTYKEDYFYGTKEERKRMRMTEGSGFFSQQEVDDDAARARGEETSHARRRRHERNKRETRHQEFLNDPDADVSDRTEPIQKQKEQFDAQRQQMLDDQTKHQAENLVEVFKKIGKGGSAAATALLALPPATSKFGEAMVEARRAAGMFDGSTAQKLAGLDIQEFQLGVRGAQNTSASTGQFLDEMREFREAYQPLKETYQDISNYLGTNAVWAGKQAAMLTEQILVLTGIKDGIDWLVGNDKKKLDKEGDHSRGHAMLNLMKDYKSPVHGDRGKSDRLPPLL